MSMISIFAWLKKEAPWLALFIDLSLLVACVGSASALVLDNRPSREFGSLNQDYSKLVDVRRITNGLPFINKISPTQGPPGVIITLTGSNFGPDDVVEVSDVTGDVQVMTVLNQSNTQLLVEMPSSTLLAGMVSILVRHGDADVTDPLYFQLTNRHTYIVSPQGLDVYGDGSKNNPWATLTKAASLAAPGDIVYIQAGLYIGSQTINTHGTPSEPIIFTAYPLDNRPPFFINLGLSDFISSLFSDEGNDTITLSGASSYITLSNFRITNQRKKGQAISLEPGSNHITVSNCEILRASGVGIIVAGDNNIIDGNRIHDNGLGANPHQDHGMDISGKNNIIQNNAIFNNWTFGLELYSGSGSAGSNLIEKNYIYNNGRGSKQKENDDATAGMIISTGQSNNVIRQNRLCGNAGYGIIIDEQSGNLLDGNITCFNEQGGLLKAYPPGTDNKFTNHISYNDQQTVLYVAPGVTADNNTYFSTLGQLAFSWSNVQQPDFASFQKVSGQDAHSTTNVDPLFINVPTTTFNPAKANSYNFCSLSQPNSWCKN